MLTEHGLASQVAGRLEIIALKLESPLIQVPQAGLRCADLTFLYADAEDDMIFRYRLLLIRFQDWIGWIGSNIKPYLRPRIEQFFRNIPVLRAAYEQRDWLENELVKSQVLLSRALEGRLQIGPFFHYNSSFDPQEVMRRHAVRGLGATPGYLTNFLGVLIDPKFFPDILQGRAGEVEDIPIPANWHADIAEWGAALRAVDLACDRFTVIELGCGWGCWMNNTGVAA